MHSVSSVYGTLADALGADVTLRVQAGGHGHSSSGGDAAMLLAGLGSVLPGGSRARHKAATPAAAAALREVPGDVFMGDLYGNVFGSVRPGAAAATTGAGAGAKAGRPQPLHCVEDYSFAPHVTGCDAVSLDRVHRYKRSLDMLYSRVRDTGSCSAGDLKC